MLQSKIYKSKTRHSTNPKSDPELDSGLNPSPRLIDIGLDQSWSPLFKANQLNPNPP